MPEAREHADLCGGAGLPAVQAGERRRKEVAETQVADEFVDVEPDLDTLDAWLYAFEGTEVKPNAELLMRWHRAVSYKLLKHEERAADEKARIDQITAHRNAPLASSLHRLEQSLLALALGEYERTEGKTKRLDTFCGRLQLSKSRSSLKVLNEEAAVEALKGAGLAEYVRVKESVAADKLKKVAQGADAGAVVDLPDGTRARQANVVSPDGEILEGLAWQTPTQPTHTITHRFGSENAEAKDED